MEQTFQEHKLTLAERKKLTLTGVTQVDGFNDETVLLRTDYGLLTVRGANLKLKTLSPEGGLVTVEGEVTALFYAKAPTSVGFWRRMLG